MPVCPEGAILSSHALIIGHRQESAIALCACELAQIEASEAVIPCIHAIGLQDILRLHRKGVIEMAVATADCASCERGQGVRLEDTLNTLNRCLLQIGVTGVKLNRRSIANWQQLQHELSGASTGAQISRRGFLQGCFNSSLQQGLELFNLLSGQQASFIPPGRMLPDSTATKLWPHLPAIDGDLCNGCDACARLCPHQAIRLEKAEGQTSYRINPRDCSGCAICTDVCDQQAVRLTEWGIQRQQAILLTTIKCTRCGNPFHIPASQADNTEAICRICALQNYHKNLYQVLN